jgi:tRNA(Ile)-lysidine synthase
MITEKKIVMKLEQKTRQFIEKFHLLSNGSGVIVGLSGGADSVALLEVLCTLRETYGLNLAAVHVHHGIRESAQKDADFCHSRYMHQPLFE